MTTTTSQAGAEFTAHQGRVTIVLQPEGQHPVELNLNVEAAREWRDELTRCLTELEQARFKEAGEKATKKRRARRAPA